MRFAEFTRVSGLPIGVNPLQVVFFEPVVISGTSEVKKDETRIYTTQYVSPIIVRMAYEKVRDALHYAAFYAAHALLRIFGKSCTQLETQQTRRVAREKAMVLTRNSGR